MYPTITSRWGQYERLWFECMGCGWTSETFDGLHEDSVLIEVLSNILAEVKNHKYTPGRCKGSDG